MATTHQNTNGNANADKMFVVLGIPGRFNDIKKPKKVKTLTTKTIQNERLSINIPKNNNSFQNDDFVSINWGGTLDEPMMRQVCEIARAATDTGYRKLMTYTFRTCTSNEPGNVVISQDKTVPKLKLDNNRVRVRVHDHYTCKYDNMQFLRHLNSKVQNQQIATIVADHCWGETTASKRNTVQLCLNI